MLRPSSARIFLDRVKLRQVHVYIAARTQGQDLGKLGEIFSFLGFSSTSASGEKPSLTVQQDNLTIKFAPAQKAGFLDRFLVREDKDAVKIEGIHISHRVNDEFIGGMGVGVASSPRQPPYFTVSEEDGSGDSTDAGSGEVRGVKEVVVPCGEANYLQLSSVRQLLCNELGGAGLRRCPDVYPFQHTERGADGPAGLMYVRALPTDVCSVVLRVDNLRSVMQSAKAADLQSSLGLQWEWIGRTGHLPQEGGSSDCPSGSNNTGGEVHVQVLSPHLSGLDLRLTESVEVCSFFNEGERSLLQGTIPDIQSARLLGGDGSVLESKYGTANDCWVEARIIAKEKVKGIVSQSLRGVMDLPSLVTRTVGRASARNEQMVNAGVRSASSLINPITLNSSMSYSGSAGQRVTRVATEPSLKE
ncbi:hypothetical protein B484DRAFT_442989 [Ochromonadaceae sp. CCMP2298]|nr:hypothetical protein B484DRAFT_442989 [Ochromonadaceae sp. CCMP2298]